MHLTLQEEEEVRERETDKLVRIDDNWGLRGYDDTLIVNCCPGLRATHMRHMRHRLASMHAQGTSVYLLPTCIQQTCHIHRSSPYILCVCVFVCVCVCL